MKPTRWEFSEFTECHTPERIIQVKKSSSKSHRAVSRLLPVYYKQHWFLHLWNTVFVYIITWDTRTPGLTTVHRVVSVPWFWASLRSVPILTLLRRRQINQKECSIFGCTAGPQEGRLQSYSCRHIVDCVISSSSIFCVFKIGTDGRVSCSVPVVRSTSVCVEHWW